MVIGSTITLQRARIMLQYAGSHHIVLYTLKQVNPSIPGYTQGFEEKAKCEKQSATEVCDTLKASRALRGKIAVPVPSGGAATEVCDTLKAAIGH